MPKLNVQQNNQNIIQAFRNALAIGNLKGIIASDGNHNFSTAGSNRNLLENAWWGSGEVVNQRAVSTFTTGAYNIDRWYFYKSATASAAALSADGVVFTYASGDMQLTQPIPASVYDYIIGKTVTLSILLSDGTIVSGTGTASASSLVTLIPRSTKFMGMIQGSNRTVYIRAYQNATIRAVKLELGSYSTLANDVPPDYKTELDKCQYRCVVYDLPGNFLFCRGIATSSTNIRGIIDLPTSMAGDKTPTISLTGSLTTPQGNTITSISAANTARNNKLAVNCTVSSVTSGSAYDIFTGSATPKIVISADL